MRNQPAPTDTAAQRAQVPERLLTFHLDSCGYAVRAAAVHGVAECGRIRTVPGAPPGVLGLVEWRGNLLTVLDLPRLLGHVTSVGPACLLRLGPPLQGTALFLPAVLRMIAASPGRLADAQPGDGLDTIELEGRRVLVIDPARLAREGPRERPPR